MKFYHWAIVAMPFVFACLLLILALEMRSHSNYGADLIYDSVPFSQLKNRPLNFPALVGRRTLPNQSW